MGPRAPLALLGTLAVASCSLTVSLDGLTGGQGGDASGDAPADAPGDAPLDAPADAAPDAPSTSDGATDGGGGPVLLAHVGGNYATGLAQQVHLVYATHAKRWWLFVADAASPTVIGSVTSADFASWTPGPSLTLPYGHDGDGRAFSVAYADRGGRDVLHFSISLRPSASDFRHYHARASVAGAALTFVAPAQLDRVPANDDTLVPDGPATAVTSSGIVVDTSGYSMKDDAGTGYGNEYAWRSTTSDDGTAGWSAAWVTLVPMASDAVLAVWEKGDVEPNPTDLHFARLVGSSWTTPDGVFSRADPLDKNDWSVWRVSDTEIHAVRRGLAGAFEHRIFDGTSWQNGAAIAQDPGAAGTGLVLVATGAGVLLAQIGGGAASPVRATTFARGAWSGWTSLVATTKRRTSLTRASVSGPAALVWTEATQAGADVVGLPLPN
jgi:hypothetical protein